MLMDANSWLVTDPEEQQRTEFEWKNRSLEKEPWEVRAEWRHTNTAGAGSGKRRL